ncbi:MAG: hypothetical protein EOO03_10580 [Chitinophagaceae bacterium]|nr:MAG: hypothetical protein EOO03_10580 [Chitinophagaceae bacterium]
MQNKFKLFLFTCILLAAGMGAKAQTGKASTPRIFKVAIFAPLYLDSVFNNGAYRYGKQFPKFALQGLDFIHGAQIALDSLPIPNTIFDTRIFDSKSYDEDVATLIRDRRLDSIDMIIGSVKDQEYIQLASFAKQKNIPFISATHPNDGGVTGNPFMVIVNPTLKAHCEAIYAYVLQNKAPGKIYLVRKPGIQENSVEDHFNNINSPDGKPLINIKVINIEGDFSVLKTQLDSTQNATIIGGSLNETFANELATYLQSISKTYKTKLIGMPNWDGFSSLTKNKKLKDFPIYYTSPFYNNKWDNYSKRIKSTYLRKYKGIPSDLTYKGFEITQQFALLLSRYPNDVLSHLNDYPSRIFSDFNFKPVFNSSDSTVPDYFENKHLYFVKILNGGYSKAW